MEKEQKKIKRATVLIVIVLILSILLPQLIGPANSGSEKSEIQYKSSSDLNGSKFVTVSGSVYGSMIEDNFPDSEIDYVTTWADMALSVVQHKADAMIMEQSSLDEMLTEYEGLAVLPDSFTVMNVSWATGKTSLGNEITALFNQYLSMVSVDGSLQALYDKWTNTATQPDHIDVPTSTATPRGRIKIVTLLDWMPFCYGSAQNPKGYFVELAYQFCAWAGYTPEFEFVNDLQSALAGFAANKYDLFSYGMIYTEEKAEELNFTDPIYGEDVFVLVASDRYTSDEEEESPQETETKAQQFWNNFKSSFEKNYVREDRWKMIVSGLAATVAMSVLSGILGCILGAILCVLRMNKNAYLTAFARLYIKIMESMPVVVILMVLYYIIFGKSSISAFWVSVIGFSLYFAAYTCEIFRSGIETVPQGQRKASLALGFNKVQTFTKVTLPQAMITIVPVLSGQFISLVQTTSIAGYISVEDLTKVSDIIRSITYEAFFPLLSTAILYFLISSVLVSALKVIEYKTNPMLRPRTIKGVKING